MTVQLRPGSRLGPGGTIAATGTADPPPPGDGQDQPPPEPRPKAPG